VRSIGDNGAVVEQGFTGAGEVQGYTGTGLVQVYEGARMVQANTNAGVVQEYMVTGVVKMYRSSTGGQDLYRCIRVQAWVVEEYRCTRVEQGYKVYRYSAAVQKYYSDICVLEYYRGTGLVQE